MEYAGAGPRRGAFYLVAALVLCVALAAALTPWLALRDPFKIETRVRLKPPGTRFADGTVALLGTDAVGRDVLSRILWGARISLVIGLFAVIVAGAIGVLAGLLAGYYGGWAEHVLMRLADIQLGFPGIMLALAVTAVLGPSVPNLIISLGITRWVSYARLVRGVVLSLREREYVEAARALGAPDRRILRRHILPGITPVLVVLATVEVGRVIIVEASLSFLGLGIQAPQPSWGGMVADGRAYLSTAWWVSTFPGLAIGLTTTAVGLLGDGLRDALDPRLRRTQ
ncbi:MAG: ABC transporter permease [Armatimonadetes bacterium]|nr:ABC transporter permease [Armatimonadota bacterium]